MKKLFLLSLVSLSSLSSAAEWKVVAESSFCAEKIQILAREGEKFVYALKGEEKLKLPSSEGAEFHQDSPSPLRFEAKTQDASYTYLHPSMVESTLPKIDVSRGTAKSRCDLRVSR